MIVDVHSHDFPDALAIRAMAGLCAKTADCLWSTGDGTLANHLDHLELAGVDKAVSCPIATRPEQYAPILRRAKGILDGAYGERARRMIVPFASVHPDDPDVVPHLEAIAAAGVRGVKFHCYYQGFSLLAPKAVRMFEAIAALGLVVQCHAGGDICWRDTRGLCGPREIEGLLKRCRGLTFIAAHLGGCFGMPEHEVDRLLDCGAYIDTSVLHARWHRDEEMRLLRTWPTERLLFATDFPWTHAPEAIRWVKSVREPKDWPAVFGGNACRLLRLAEA